MWDKEKTEKSKATPRLLEQLRMVVPFLESVGTGEQFGQRNRFILDALSLICHEMAEGRYRVGHWLC